MSCFPYFRLIVDWRSALSWVCAKSDGTDCSSAQPINSIWNAELWRGLLLREAGKDVHLAVNANIKITLRKKGSALLWVITSVVCTLEKYSRQKCIFCLLQKLSFCYYSFLFGSLFLFSWHYWNYPFNIFLQLCQCAKYSTSRWPLLIASWLQWLLDGRQPVSNDCGPTWTYYSHSQTD